MFDVLLIALASAFIANVVTLKSGPGFVFLNMRRLSGIWISKKTLTYGSLINAGALSPKQFEAIKIKSDIVRSLGEMINCPFCIGPWLVMAGVAIFANENFVVNWLVGSGLLYILLGWMNHD